MRCDQVVDATDRESYQRPIRLRSQRGIDALLSAACRCWDRCRLGAGGARACLHSGKQRRRRQYGVPKFDLEEQSKNFRKDGSAATSNGNGLYETPFGNGKLQFGIQPGGSSNFGSVFGPGLGPSGSAQSQRQEFDRRLAPPTSLEYNGVR